MTLVKICGVTLADDAAHASAVGADFIGLNFWKRGRRYVTPQRAAIVAAAARGAGAARVVGVFVDADADDIRAVTDVVALDAVQLHGDDAPGAVAELAAATRLPVWKAIAVTGAAELVALPVWPCEALVLDAPTPLRGGAGARFDHALAAEARRRWPALRIVLAGGLTPDTVAEAIHAVDPWCLDVASGVEVAPGVKDAMRVAAFVAAVRSRQAGG
jgi:phosphoribosylanthranilate isomerase